MSPRKKGPDRPSGQAALFNPEHRFGGDWTEQKLGILERYLEAYLIALKNQNFYKIYIDAFAGTGYRSDTAPADEPGQTTLFSSDSRSADIDPSDEVDLPTQTFLEGVSSATMLNKRVEPA